MLSESNIIEKNYHFDYECYWLNQRKSFQMAGNKVDSSTFGF
jgi:hypothetical protein